MKKILFITNGHGEDIVAFEIMKQLRGNREVHSQVSEPKIMVFPLVGEGKAFDILGIEIIGARNNIPGGGFSLRNLKFLFRDISAGLIGKTIDNYRQLKKSRGRVDLTVAVGDIVPIISALIVGAPFIFVGVNKSDYYQSFGSRYTPWEKWLLKKYAKKIFVRDQLTQNNLNKQGINAEYVGNPLMDCLEKMSNVKCQMSNEGRIIVGLLPGTREDAKLNLEDFEKIVEELMAMKQPDTNFKFLIATALPDIPEYMERKSFGEVLAGSDLIVGLSGTGNEQAAGSGKPVVSFYGRGAQYNKKFAETQKQLLGGALELIKSRDSRTIAAAIWNLINSPDKMSEMGKIGKERMGEDGAVERIARRIIT